MWDELSAILELISAIYGIQYPEWMIFGDPRYPMNEAIPLKHFTI